MKKCLIPTLLSLSCVPIFAQGPDCCVEDNPAFNGLYIGGNVGVLSYNTVNNDADSFLQGRGAWPSQNTNVTAGGQIGYDLRCQGVVWGLLGDWNWANNSFKIQSESNDPTDDSYITGDLDWYATIRGRGGITLCRTLLYLTAGGAVSKMETNWRNIAESSTNISYDKVQWGWVGGVGIEAQPCSSWSFGFELLGLHFGNYTKSGVDSDGTRYQFAHNSTDWMLRFNVNYHFGRLCSLWCR